jgi:hypothetical protein
VIGGVTQRERQAHDQNQDQCFHDVGFPYYGR